MAQRRGRFFIGSIVSYSSAGNLMQRKLNVRLFVWTVVLLVPTGIAVHFVHGFQVRQHAQILLERGDSALAQAQPEQALAAYTQYLGFVPGDLAAREKYVRLLDRVAAPADRMRVVLLMQQLLLAHPDLHDIRFRLVHNLIAVGRIGDAAQQLGLLAGNWGEPAELKHMLGWCQEAREQYKEACDSFRDAIRLDPARVSSYALLAEVLSDRLGDAEEARRTLDAMVTANPRAHEAFLIRSRFHLRQGDEAAADKDLKTALELAPGQPEAQSVAILHAELLAARQDLHAAREALQQAVDRARRTKSPQLAPLWCALAELAEHEGRPDAADQALSQAETEVGDCLDIRLTRCRLWANRSDAAARRNLAALGEGLDKLNPAARTRVRRELAETWGRLGDTGRAEALWRQVASELSQDVHSRFALVELALQAGQPDRARTLLVELRRREGSQGMLWRYGTAAVNLLEARTDRTRLADARKLLAELQRQHPDWGRIPLLQARADELEGRFDSATRNYERAVELGEVQAGVVHRLVELLLERQDYLRAEEALSRLGATRPWRPALVRLGTEVAAGNRNAPLAQARARQAAPLPSRDYRDYLWRAHIDQAIGRPRDAELLLREAVRIADHVPDVWVALVEHLAQSSQAAAAETVLGQVRGKLPSDLRALALARCHEALHQLSLAEAQYDQALAAAPTDFIALARAAEFYSRQDRPDRAEPLLRRLLAPAAAAPAGHTAGARRQLAALLAARGDREEALDLLAANRVSHGDNTADDRVRWYVHGQDPAERARCLTQFQDSLARQPASAAERLLLGDLCLAAGKPAQARSVLQPLATHAAPVPQHVGPLRQRSDPHRRLRRGVRVPGPTGAMGTHGPSDAPPSRVAGASTVAKGLSAKVR
jgi:tetratricopeptide (TPR) repeat protein